VDTIHALARGTIPLGPLLEILGKSQPTRRFNGIRRFVRFFPANRRLL
jgi:hypothetical protein